MRVTGSPAYTVIAFSYLLIIIYALTLAPICWVYAAEVWSLETRATGMGISAIGNWYVAHTSIPRPSHPLTPPLLGFSTSPSASSSHPPSSTSAGASLSCSARCVSPLQYSSGSRTRRRAARRSRRLRCYLVMMARGLGGRRRDPSGCTRRLRR
jgi:hypothetical protein